MITLHVLSIIILDFFQCFFLVIGCFYFLFGNVASKKHLQRSIASLYHVFLGFNCGRIVRNFDVNIEETLTFDLQIIKEVGSQAGDPLAKGVLDHIRFILLE